MFGSGIFQYFVYMQAYVTRLGYSYETIDKYNDDDRGQFLQSTVIKMLYG